MAVDIPPGTISLPDDCLQAHIRYTSRTRASGQLGEPLPLSFAPPCFRETCSNYALISLGFISLSAGTVSRKKEDNRRTL